MGISAVCTHALAYNFPTFSGLERSKFQIEARKFISIPSQPTSAPTTTTLRNHHTGTALVR